MILVVDHQDSFVYNLVQLVSAAGHPVRVVSSTASSASELVAEEPQGVILSPGPGRPEQAGCFVELLRTLPAATPVLGVCLGHQALAAAFGGSVVRAPEPVHGKVSQVSHDGKGIFLGLPSPLLAGRYHSLIVERTGLPAELEICADTEDGLVMAIRHRQRPFFGVQFHPESVLTPLGPRMVDNFLALTAVARR